MNWLRCLAASLAGAVLTTGALAANDENPPRLAWRSPAAAEVPWRGMLPTDGNGVGVGPQIGLYVVPGPAGLLAAIFTHGAVMQGVQSAQRKREQDQADKVLEPYAALLKAWPASSLWEAAAGGREQLWDGVSPAPGAVVELVPVFSMTQDAQALVLDVSVQITPAVPALLPDGPAWVVVRVVSSPLPAAAPVAAAATEPAAAADPTAQWSANDGARLKATAASLLGHAVELAARHGPRAAGAATDPLPPARTYRYAQGGVERSERGQRLAGDCARLVLRTLRGGLLSVPSTQPVPSVQPAAADCPAPAAP